MLSSPLKEESTLLSSIAVDASDVVGLVDKNDPWVVATVPV